MSSSFSETTKSASRQDWIAPGIRRDAFVVERRRRRSSRTMPAAGGVMGGFDDAKTLTDAAAMAEAAEATATAAAALDFSGRDMAISAASVVSLALTTALTESSAATSSVNATLELAFACASQPGGGVTMHKDYCSSLYIVKINS